MNDILLAIASFLPPLIILYILYYDCADIARRIAREREQRIHQLEECICELRSRLPREELTEAEIFEMESEAEAEAIIRESMGRGPFS